jgi:hypothetical protein
VIPKKSKKAVVARESHNYNVKPAFLKLFRGFERYFIALPDDSATPIG